MRKRQRKKNWKKACAAWAKRQNESTWEAYIADLRSQFINDMFGLFIKRNELPSDAVTVDGKPVDTDPAWNI
jgi:hypothetical protein